MSTTFITPLSTSLRPEAERLTRAGLVVLPAIRAQKRPTVPWKRYQTERFDKLDAFDVVDALCVVCGPISGNLEILDFDFKAQSFDRFCEEVGKRGGTDVLNQCLLETSQSGGKHLAFKRTDAPGKNTKLASVAVDASGVGPSVDFQYYGKTLRTDANGNAFATTIETRGDGGICLIAPTAGYTVERGDWGDLPVLFPDEVAILFDAALACSDRLEPPPAPARAPAGPRVLSSSLNVGAVDNVADYLRASGRARAVLEENGWKLFRETSAGEQWTRPGKDFGVSGILDTTTDRFYCFTSNASPLESNGNYTPLQLVAAFEFGGDISAASKEYARAMREERANLDAAPAVLSFELGSGRAERVGGTDGEKETDAEERGEIPTKTPFPEELFNCGGLLQALQEHTQAAATRDQPELAFAGALACVSFLTARKITALNNRVYPNVYVLGLGGASSGKNAARETNRKALEVYDPDVFLTEKFESVQALQNMIQARQKVLLQQDEFGAELKAFTADKGGNRVGIITEMLRLFSNSGNDRYLPRVVAASAKVNDASASVVYPNLILYGTTNYNDFADSITREMLKNGFVARTTIIAGRLYAPKKRTDKTSQKIEFSENVCETIRQWKAFRDCKAFEIPELFDVPVSNAAFRVLSDFDFEFVEPLYRRAVKQDDPIAETAGRIGEKCWKYALLFAASKFGPDEDALKIDVDSVEKAILLARYELDLFKELKATEMAENEVEKTFLNVKKWILSRDSDVFTKNQFTRSFQRLTTREREDVLTSLIDGEYIERVVTKPDGPGRPKVFYIINRD